MHAISIPTTIPCRKSQHSKMQVPAQHIQHMCHDNMTSKLPHAAKLEQLEFSTSTLASVITGIPDAEEIPEPACYLMKQLISGAWADIPDADQLVEMAISTRQQRAETYVT